MDLRYAHHPPIARSSFEYFGLPFASSPSAIYLAVPRIKTGMQIAFGDPA